jgi:DNA primase
MLNNDKICDHLEDILDHFGIKYKVYNNRYSFPCPIHAGDKKDGVSLFKKGQKSSGNWVCWTNHCEQEFGKSTVGFVKGCFESLEDKKLEFPQLVRWLEGLIGENLQIDDPTDYRPKKQSIYLSNNLTEENKVHKGVDRHLVRSRLKIPSDYFIKRGFSQNILDKYDVGLCLDRGKQMYGRVVVPVYNDSWTEMIGCVGRTLSPKCDICNKYHGPHETCPISSYAEYQAAKWINSKGFNSEHYLYNFWHAKDFINLYKTAILVEGQGDVWKLEEADIHCGLGLFGTSLTPYQKIKLEKTGAINIIIATDNDPAGIEAKYNLTEQLERLYNIETIVLPSKDVGELTIEQSKEIFLPILNKLNKDYV